MNDLERRANVFGMIFMLSNKLQILGDKMDPLMTVKQWLFIAGLMRCESKTPTLSEIASRIGSSRQNVKKMAVILEKQGFVLMEKDTLDARVLRIGLTDACKEHLKQRDEMERGFIKELFNGFGTDELEQLSDALGKLENNLIEMGRRYERGEE